MSHWGRRGGACCRRGRGKVTFGTVLVMRIGSGSSGEGISSGLVIDRVTRNSWARP
jgi:hypothetical protein